MDLLNSAGRVLLRFPILSSIQPMFIKHLGSLVAQMVESAHNAGDLDLIPGLGKSPGEGNIIHSSILAWRIPWREEPGGL